MSVFDSSTRQESTLLHRFIVASDGTVNTASIDTADYLAVFFNTMITSYTDGTYTFVVQESVDDSVWTNVPADKFIDEQTNSALDVSAITSVGSVLNKLGVFSTDRFLRLVHTSASVTTGATVVVTTTGKLKAV